MSGDGTLSGYCFVGKNIFAGLKKKADQLFRISRRQFQKLHLSPEKLPGLCETAPG